VYDECEEAFCGDEAVSSYDDLVDLLVQTGKPDEAFRYLERSNARKVYESLSGLECETGQPVATANLDTLRNIRSHMIGAERQIEQLLATKPHHTELIASVVQVFDSCRRALSDRSDRITQAYPMLIPFIRFDGITTAEVQNRAPADGLVLVYAFTSRSVYTFVVTRARTVAYVSPGGRLRVTLLANEYLSLLQSRSIRIDSAVTDIASSRRRLEDLTRSLYEIFLLPAESFLRTAVQIDVVLPVGEPTVPIHALRRSASASSLYLGDRASVRYFPTCRSIPTKMHAGGPVKTVVGFGHPGDTEWDVEYELRDIRAFYREARLFFGREANLDTLRRIRADVLHLALALQFNGQLPGTSYMLLSDGESATTYRRVSIGEIFSMQPSGTVFFSNINEHFTSVHSALSQLFMANGTDVLITNCVPSSRRAKKIFGEMYYTALMTGSTSPVAFRKAQQELIRSREYGSPEVWAPFMMWGE
jgi:hypothetical protein